MSSHMWELYLWCEKTGLENIFIFLRKKLIEQDWFGVTVA